MTLEREKKQILALLERSSNPLTLDEICRQTVTGLAERTLRRWLSTWVAEDVVLRTGTGRATRYLLSRQNVPTPFRFLRGLEPDLARATLAQIRDLWTHTSTALEGNTLSLGDTHFVLQDGLTISGKPIQDHQEVIGHASAIDLLYRCLEQPLSNQLLFALHKAVQTESVTDIYKPNGDWKIESNGSQVVTRSGRAVFVEYAAPKFVPELMAEVIAFVNCLDADDLNMEYAPEIYSKIHMGIVHIHPFWDGNGRIARLLANIPLLRSGIPPIIISFERRRAYIEVLAKYQLTVGKISLETGVWPDEALLGEFDRFCGDCYKETQTLIANAFELQNLRN